VFVELSPEVCKHDHAVLATLSHELSHKFLYLHLIRNGNVQIEQEFLTDVTAVYLGLGKIMLNGCECESTQQYIKDGRTTTQFHTLQTGYLSRECFAFLHRLICSMRGIPSDVMLRGLTAASKDAVRKVERDYANWFTPELRTAEGLSSLVANMTDATATCQDEAASQHLVIRRMERSLGEFRKGINDSHRPLIEARNKIAALAEARLSPHLTYLEALESKESVAD
jgi:hypothetical protein